MAIPRKPIDILGYSYTVEYNDLLAERGLLGEIQLLHGKIYLRPGMTDEVEEVVLDHEIGHGILFHSGIKEHDEKHLDVLSSGYRYVRRKNPGLYKVGK